MFRLTRRERDEVVTNCDHLQALKFSHNMPLAFTEHGLAMLSSVLNSPRAIQANIQIIKTFIRLRALAASYEKLLGKIGTLEKKCDARFKLVFDALRELMTPAEKPRSRIGFKP